MPQISPMNWSILILFFFWILVSIMVFISLESVKSHSLKTVKLFSQKWNW